MSATAEAPPRLTREQAAEKLKELLTEEPQSAAELRRQILGPQADSGDSHVVRNGLDVLEAQHFAERVPRRGWKLYDAKAQRAKQTDAQTKVEFRGTWGMIDVSKMFIDPAYQRPTTSFVQRIETNFDPLLFQTLALSDRGKNGKAGKPYAIVDGQSRWVAASRLKVGKVPCVIYTGLTPEDEADLFAKLQKERRGMATWYRFRASLAAKNPEALAIKKLVEETGFEVGDQEGQIKAVAALEATFRKDEFLLSRSLADFKEAFPNLVPEDVHIRGMHRFFREYPVGKPKKGRKADRPEPNDGTLVTRLKVAGPDGLKRRMNAVKEGGTVKGGNDLMMAYAIQGAYNKTK